MCALFLTIFTVKAQSIAEIIKENGTYTNKNGVEITEENYNKVKDYYSEEKIDNISKQLYEVIKNSRGMKGYDEEEVSTGYYEGTGVNHYSTRVYKNGELINSSLYDIVHEWTETESKTLQLSAFYEDGGITISIENSWKPGKLPKYRSYDVLALRWAGGYTLKKGFRAEQDYGYGEDEIVFYDTNSVNKNDFFNGVGLSQNLVDGATSYYQFMNQNVSCSGQVTFYGTYQHAQADVTLEQSKSYSLSSSGMGGVIKFYDSVAPYYDNTPGLSITFTC